MKEMENEFEGFESIELLCNKKRRRRKLRGDLTFLQILQFSAIYTVAATWAVRAPNIHGDAPDYKLITIIDIHVQFEYILIYSPSF